MTLDTFTEHAHGNQPDAALAPLSRQQAALLVQLGLRAATSLGLDVTYEGGAALVPPDHSARGPVLGLSNLARMLARYDETCWPMLVDEHFTEILRQLRAGPPTPPADPSRELIQRLVPRDALPDNWTADRPDFVPGLLAVPSSVDDDIVTMWLEPADLGLVWSEAERLGLANLRSMVDHVEYLEQDDVRVALVTGSAFAASRALVLDTVLRETLQLEHPPPYGVLAAMPARDRLLLHVIQDLSVIPALGLLLHLTARSHTRDPGPLSPDVYLVTPSLTWHPATTASPDRLPLRMSPELQSLSERLAEFDAGGN
ncbi:hypothetical protein AB0E69_16035 [Kribbella sp. NPDC026611]|uniref:hypothetical protein n=1 Tax=Kribbella sp. NPDC026611 TaxID=3154911 RepID=UPI0033DD75FD